MLNDVDKWSNMFYTSALMFQRMLSGTTKMDLLNHLVIKFSVKADMQEEWVKDKEELLKSRDFLNCSLNKVKVLKKKHDIFELEVASQQTQVRQITAIGHELTTLGYPVTSRCQSICYHWHRILNLTNERNIALKETEKVFERLDVLYLQFARRVVPFNSWLDGALQDLMDVFIVRFIKEIQDLVNACQQFKSKFLEADREHFSIVSLSQEIESIVTQYQLDSGTGNSYTTLTAQDISNKWLKVKQLLPKRDQILETENLRNQISERLCRLFTEKANIVGPWIDRQIHSVVTIAIEVNASLEEKLSKLSENQMAVKIYKPNMDELELIHQEILKLSMIVENTYTNYTMETLRFSWKQLVSSVQTNIDEVENLIGIRDSNGITTEQLNRFRVSFYQFDIDRTGKLNADQFESCLLSLGYNFTEDIQGGFGSDFQQIINAVDPNNTGYITFDAFLHFVTQEKSDNDLENIINSFRILSSYKPYITVEDLSLRLSSDNANYCIQRMPSYNGQDSVPGSLDYLSFSRVLYEKELLKRKNVEQD